MKKEQYIITGGDESYTYPSLITPIIEKIEEYRISKSLTKAELKIWCPFDVDRDTKYKDFLVMKSNFVEIFRIEGYNVIATHIAIGQDFFEYEPEYFDIMISNPPFKEKRKFLERALQINRPFALLFPAPWLNDGGLYQLFHNKKLQLFMPDKRPCFFNENGAIGTSPSFKAIYYCYNFLQEGDIQWFELIREKIKINN